MYSVPRVGEEIQRGIFSKDMEGTNPFELSGLSRLVYRLHKCRRYEYICTHIFHLAY